MIRRIALLFSGWQVAGQKSGALYRWVNSFEQGWVSSNERQSLLKNIQEGKAFKKASPVKWHCRNCGYVFEGKEVPDKCPVCQHPQAYFEVLAENY